MVEALDRSPIPPPAIRLTLDDEPFRLKLVTFGPMILIVELLTERVILFPPTSETLSLVPLSVNVAPPPPPPPATLKIILFPSCESVILLLPTRVINPPEIREIVPAV